MKYRILIILFFPLFIWSQNLIEKSEILNFSSVDDFINSFYQNHNSPKKMIPFFEASYYETFYKFIDHMDIKNIKYGIFLEKKLKKFSILDKNIILVKYKVKYQNGYTIEKLTLKKTITNSYKIFYWYTHR